jgi:hypothetical protein
MSDTPLTDALLARLSSDYADSELESYLSAVKRELTILAKDLERKVEKTFVAGMEEAAKLLDQEIASANAILKEANFAEGGNREIRVDAVRTNAEAMAQSIRHFAADEEWRRVGPEMIWLAVVLVVAVLVYWTVKPWDGWIGNFDGEPVYWKKKLLSIGSITVRLHKFVKADDVECFHSHPFWAVRIVLWGGYVEEIYDPPVAPTSIISIRLPKWKAWKPLRVGLVRPEFTHRIAWLLRGVSYSLWIHGSTTSPIYLRGQGWPEGVGNGTTIVRET